MPEGIFNRKPKTQETEAVDPKMVEALKNAIAAAPLMPEESAKIDTPEKLDDITKRVLGFLKAHQVELTEEVLISDTFLDALQGALGVTSTAPGFMVTDKEGTVIGVKPTKAAAEDMIREEKMARGREGADA
jgi:hypothetical protein